MLTKLERQALKGYWQMPLRVKDGNVELKKGDCWGILCSESEGKENAQMIIEKARPDQQPITTASGNTVYRTRYQAQKNKPHGYKIVQVYDGYIVCTPQGYQAILKARRS